MTVCANASAWRSILFMRQAFLVGCCSRRNPTLPGAETAPPGAVLLHMLRFLTAIWLYAGIPPTETTEEPVKFDFPEGVSVRAQPRPPDQGLLERENAKSETRREESHFTSIS